MAEILVDAGAHLTRAEGDEIFFSPPDGALQAGLKAGLG